MNFSQFLTVQSWWEVPSIAYFCSLFRTAFKLLDFDIEELEEALLADGLEESASSLLTELIVRLLNGCLGNNDISAFNYQMYLRRIFRQKCQETSRYNPFNTDIDFQFLPLRTKVEILYALCDFRLDAEDVLDLFKNLEAESLRVEPLGFDDDCSAYWYFYGTRLYREDLKKKKGKHKRKKKESGKLWFYGDDYLDEDDTERVWQVVCFTEADWLHLTDRFSKATSKVEKELYRSLSQNFLPEIPRLFQEKERLQRKRLLETAPRRTSNRVLQKIKQKEESKQSTDDNKEPDEEPQPTTSSGARASRAKRRNLIRSKSESSSSSESLKEMPQKVTKRRQSQDKRSKNSSATNKGEPPPEPPVKTGRKTNNSLASATGQIVIPDNDEPASSTRKKLKTSQIFSQTEEDIKTDMYKVLEQITAHDDAWPFMDPVEEEYAPNYYAVIRRPMDLRKMEERLDTGHYRDFASFKGDFKLIVNNCRLYNGQDNEYTVMVDSLAVAFDRLTEKYMHRISSSDEEIAVEYPLPTPSRKHKLKRSESPQVTQKKKKRKSHSESEPKSSSSDLVPEHAADSDADKESKADLKQEAKKSKDSHKSKDGKSKKKRKGHHRHSKHSKKRRESKSGDGEDLEREEKKKRRESKSGDGEDLEKEVRKKRREPKSGDVEDLEREEKKKRRESKSGDGEDLKKEVRKKRREPKSGDGENLEREEKKKRRELKSGDGENFEREEKRKRRELKSGDREDLERKESKKRHASKSGDGEDLEREERKKRRGSKTGIKEDLEREERKKRRESKSGDVEDFEREERKKKKQKSKNKEKKLKLKKKKSKHQQELAQQGPSVVRAETPESMESSNRSRSASPLPSIRTVSPSPPPTPAASTPEPEPESQPSDQLSDPDFFKDKYDKIKERRRGAAKDVWESLFDYKQKCNLDKLKNLSAPDSEKNSKLRETIEKLKAKHTDILTDDDMTVTDLFPVSHGKIKKKDKDIKSKDLKEPKLTKSKEIKTGKEIQYKDSKSKEPKPKDTKAKEFIETEDNADESAEENEPIKKPVKAKSNSKRGPKKSTAKNESATEALEEAVKDMTKWFEDGPKGVALSSPEVSPAQTVSTEEQDSRQDDELSQSEKSSTYSKREASSSRKRHASRDNKVVKRREIQRTIDRLQPGKSKGNLLTNVMKKEVEKEKEESASPGAVTKVRETTKSAESSPKLSLGSVLPAVNFTIGKQDHKFDKKEAVNDVPTITPDVITPEEKVKPLEIVEKREETVVIMDKKEVEVPVPVTKKDAEVETEPPLPIKPNQATPNLSAWFKAFGAPKSTPSCAAKKKTDEGEEERPTEPGPSETRISLTNPDTPNPEGGESPLPNPTTTPRQRRTSTGSSVSERSSFSQDLDSPRHQMSLTSPLLRSPASPRDDFQKITYPIINGSVRAGFYQDTTSIRSSPEKSCSPREGPTSPFSPYSQQHVYTSNNAAGSATPQYFADHNKSPLPSYSQNPPPYYDTAKAPVVSKPRAHEDYTSLGPDTFQQSQIASSYSPVYSPYTQTSSSYSPVPMPPQSNSSNAPVNTSPASVDTKCTNFPMKKRMYSEPQTAIPPVKSVEKKEAIAMQNKIEFTKPAPSVPAAPTSVDDIALALSEKSELAKLREKNAADNVTNDDKLANEQVAASIEPADIERDIKKDANTNGAKPTSTDSIDMVNMGYMNPDYDRRIAGETLESDLSIMRDKAKSNAAQHKIYDVDTIALNLGINNQSLHKTLSKNDIVKNASGANVPPAHGQAALGQLSHPHHMESPELSPAQSQPAQALNKTLGPSQLPAHALPPGHSQVPAHTQPSGLSQLQAHTQPPGHSQLPAHTQPLGHSQLPAHTQPPGHSQIMAHTQPAHTQPPAHSQPAHSQLSAHSQHLTHSQHLALSQHSALVQPAHSQHPALSQPAHSQNLTHSQHPAHSQPAHSQSVGSGQHPAHSQPAHSGHAAQLLAHSQQARSQTPAHERAHPDMNVNQHAAHSHHLSHYDHLTGGQPLSNFSMSDIELANKKLYSSNSTPSTAIDYGNWKLSQMRKQEMLAPSDYSTAYQHSINQSEKHKQEMLMSSNYNKNLQQQYNMYNVPRANLQRSQDLQQGLPAELRIPNPRGHIKNDHMSPSLNNPESANKHNDSAKTHKPEKLVHNHPLVTSNPYKTPYSNPALQLDSLRNIPQMLERYSTDERFLSSFTSGSSTLYDKQFQMAQMFNKSMASELPTSSASANIYSQPSMSLSKDSSIYKTSHSANSQPDKQKQKRKKRTSESKPTQVPGNQPSYHTSSSTADMLSSVKSGMMPTSSFNFGTSTNMATNMALSSGIYGETPGFSAANQLMAANYMVAAVAHQQRNSAEASAAAEKLAKPAHQASSHATGFPFLGHGQVRPGYGFVGSGVEPGSPLYQQYLQRQEELIRQTGAQIMGLYPPPYPASLGVSPQTYEPNIMNRHSWL